MSFKSNDSQQITLNDALFGLTDREKRMLEKSWAKPFAEKIFPKIDESRFYVCTVIKHHVQTHLSMYVPELLLSRSF